MIRNMHSQELRKKRSVDNEDKITVLLPKKNKETRSTEIIH